MDSSTVNTPTRKHSKAHDDPFREKPTKKIEKSPSTSSSSSLDTTNGTSNLTTTSNANLTTSNPNGNSNLAMSNTNGTSHDISTLNGISETEPNVVVTEKTLNSTTGNAGQEQPISYLEKAEEDIKADLEKVLFFMLKYSCNIQTIWMFTDRYFGLMAKNLKRDKEKLVGIVYELVKSGLVELKEAKDQQHVENWKTLLEMEDYLKHDLSSITQLSRKDDKTPFAETNQRTGEIVMNGLKSIEQIVSISKHAGLSIPGFNAEVAANKLDRIKKLIDQNCFKIVIIGLEKGGKSTFVNYILGFDLLPTRTDRCTYLTTVIKVEANDTANNKGNTIRVEVHYFTKEEFDTNCETLLKSGEMKPEEVKEIEEARKAFQPRNVESLPEDKPENIRKKLWDLVGPNAKRNQFFVKKVILATNIFKTSVPVEITDVPGADSRLTAHRVLAMESIKQADAVIFMHATNRPDLTQPQQKLIESMKNEYGSAIFAKSFAILTNIDRVPGTQSAKNAFEVAKSEFKKAGFFPEHVFPAVPVLDLLQIMATNYAPLVSPEQMDAFKAIDRDVSSMHPWLKGTTEKAKEYIYRFIQNDLPKSRCKETKDVLVVVVQAVATLKDEYLQAFPDVDASEKDTEKQFKSDVDRSTSTNFEEGYESGNEFKYKEVALKKDSVFPEFVESFKKRYHNLAGQDIKCRDLTSLVPRHAEHAFVMTDARKIEQRERERLFECHMSTIERTIDEIPNCIINQLFAKYFNIVLSAVCEQPALLEYKIDNVLNKEQFKTEIKATIMRVAYPSGAALLLWPKDHPNRTHAIDELRLACPETAPALPTVSNNNSKLTSQ